MLIGHTPGSLLCPKVYKHIFPLHSEKEINQLINESINRLPPSCSTTLTATLIESAIIVTSCSPLCPTQPFYKGPCPGCRGHRAEAPGHQTHQVAKPNEPLLTSYCGSIVQCELPPSRKSPVSVSGSLLSSEFSLTSLVTSSQAPQGFAVVCMDIPVLISFPVTGRKHPGERN